MKDLIQELMERTWETGREHAIISFQPGARGILMGGRDGIALDFDFSRVLVHTHPVQNEDNMGPSDADFSFVRGSKTQSSSWLIELLEDGSAEISKFYGF